jgi:hypothetical protein
MKIIVTLEVEIPDGEVTGIKLTEGLRTDADVRQLTRSRICMDTAMMPWLQEASARVTVKGKQP